jgi:hypothetical protein
MWVPHPFPSFGKGWVPFRRNPRKPRPHDRFASRHDFSRTDKLGVQGIESQMHAVHMNNAQR